MATIVFMPNATYQPGSHNFGPISVPQNLTNVVISFDRSQWTNPNTTLALSLDLSLDGGVTWNNPAADAAPFPAGIEAQGGVALDKNGVPYAVSAISIPVPQPGTTDRQVRGNLTLAGGPILTTGTITTS